MAHISLYLNFNGNAEEAFSTYKTIFNSELSTPIMRFGDLPADPGMPPLSEEDQKKVLHVALPILGGIEIMGTDVLECLGQKLIGGNNITISLNPDTKTEADRLYKELSQGGTGSVAPHDEFWGYWGVCIDKYGINWMFNVTNQPSK